MFSMLRAVFFKHYYVRNQSVLDFKVLEWLSSKLEYETSIRSKFYGMKKWFIRLWNSVATPFFNWFQEKK